MVSVMSVKEVFKNRSEMLEAERKKELLFKEINNGFKDPIDRNIFKKPPEEKGKLLTLKSEWEKNMKICYPDPKERRYRNNAQCI